MEQLYDVIRRLVREDKYVVGQHASERLEERGIMKADTMRIPGERIKRTRLVQTDKYVVALEVEMVIPADDPTEPCYESETIELIREVKARAEKDDLAWLSRRGKVYAAVGAA